MNAYRKKKRNLYLAVLVFITFARINGSIPNRTPKAIASLVPIMEIANAKLLQSLAISPPPTCEYTQKI